jgi:hypothetical protein
MPWQSFAAAGGIAMKQMKHWQDPVNAVLGAWLVLSPWILGFSGERMAMINAVIIGAALVAASLGAVFVPRAWEEWVEGVLGLWMAASPWLLGYSKLQAATTSAFLTGLVILALALWVLMTDRDYGWMRGDVAH